MPPPPSQRGKFRPKKPQKKTSKVSAPTEPLSSSAAATATEPGAVPGQRNNTPIVAANRGGDRGRGRGRGGRGGRGRGRIPIPQGTVFFTGSDKKQAGAAKGSSGGKTSIKPGVSRTKGSSKSKDGKDPNDTSTEEVVGQLETAIGGTGKAKKKSILERETGDYEDDDGPIENAGAPMNLSLTAGCMYDSDSSDDRSISRRPRNTSVIAPLELPFPEKALPTGVGGLRRPESYAKSTAGQPEATNSAPIDTMDNITQSESASPFVALHKRVDVAEEKDSWFLVQLPTRLPPMKKNFSSSGMQLEDENIPGGHVGNENATPEAAQSSSDANNAINNISEVVVPPVATGSFDNGLNMIAPGRIGKILVYKSGRTVLVMEGSNGKKVTMDVNEGLSCSFHQQAVSVNIEEGEYVTLGDVNKSIVITPDLSCM